MFWNGAEEAPRVSCVDYNNYCPNCLEVFEERVLFELLSEEFPALYSESRSILFLQSLSTRKRGLCFLFLVISSSLFLATFDDDMRTDFSDNSGGLLGFCLRRRGRKPINWVFTMLSEKVS